MGGAAGVDERGPTRALVLASEVDSSFCAGADLKERAGFSSEEFVASIDPPSLYFHEQSTNNNHPAEQQPSSPTSAILSQLSPSYLYLPYPLYHLLRLVAASN